MRRGLRQLCQVVGGVCQPQRQEEEVVVGEGEEGESDHQLKVQLQRMKL